MREMASVLAAYLAFVCAHAAGTGRLPPIGKWRGHRAPLALRIVSVAAFLGSAALWPREGTLLISILGASLSFFVSASAVILLRPLFPRAIWGLAWAAPFLIAALVVESDLVG